MNAVHPHYRYAAYALGLSALLHLFAGPFSGWADVGLLLIPIGLIYLLAAAGLKRGWRWLAYLVFVCMLVGTLICYAAFGSEIAKPIPSALIVGIVVTDLACAAVLFGILWKDRIGFT